MAKSPKKEKSELDAILDQLKNTYRADSPDVPQNDLMDTDESDIDVDERTVYRYKEKG